jgi:purine-binding chemotaxis protein CheW
VLEVGEQDIEPTPQLGTRIAPEFIAGMARSRGEIVSILNLERVLEREEMAKLIGDHRVAA